MLFLDGLRAGFPSPGCGQGGADAGCAVTWTKCDHGKRSNRTVGDNHQHRRPSTMTHDATKVSHSSCPLCLSDKGDFPPHYRYTRMHCIFAGVSTTTFDVGVGEFLFFFSGGCGGYWRKGPGSGNKYDAAHPPATRSRRRPQDGAGNQQM
ncbi:hypothetical protein BJX66DRAFT_154974 [Aspergillus keveii]|uniref:Uncharacterized protein n=1 Tax=Aspergillus keveii TaxID=714993 RepID=A0ABR4GBQ3_9EURO